MNVTLLRHTINPLVLTETAACVCYNSEPTYDGRISKSCYKSGHQSVLEHVNFTWKIEGVSRALLAQLTRHRVASFSVQSQRYCDMNGANMVIPPSISDNEEATQIYLNALRTIAITYDALISLSIPKEDARFILPNACSTSIVMTMNLRELIHFCNLRLCSRAQWEIRNLASEMVSTVNAATDNQFAYALVPICEANTEFPFCPESKDKTCGKHPRLAEVYTLKVNKGEKTDAK